MRLGLVLVITAMLTISTRASATDVVLVHPVAADPFIDEIFNRVRGELRARAIPFEEEAGSEDSAEPAQQAVLQRTHSIACLFFVWHGDTSLIRVWVNDGSPKPPALFEAVALERNPEVPTLLAARAVDLLAAALRTHRAPASSTPPTSAPSRAPEAIVDDTPHFSRWSLGAGVTELGAPSPWGAAWGPQIFTAVRLSPGLELDARVAGPLTGARAENAEASARWSQWLGLLAFNAELARFGPGTLGAVAEAGAHYLDARGAVAEGVSSIAPAHQTHFTATVAAGISGAIFLSSRVSLRFDAQALLLVPPPRIAIGGEAASFGEPALELSLGLCSKF
jgi:hypothetical protein